MAIIKNQKLNFTKYLKLNNQIEKRYNYLKNYEQIKNLFNLQLRLDFTRNSGLANKNLQHITKKTFFFGNVLIKEFIFYYTKIYGFFFPNSKIFIRSNVLSDYFQKKLENDFKKKKLSVIGIGNYQKNFNKTLLYLISHCWFFDLLERSSEIYKTLNLYNCDNISKLKKLIKKKIFLKNLKFSYEKDMTFISKILKNLNIIGIILHNDQTPFNNLLVNLGNNINIKTTVLAHGIFNNNPKFLSILPSQSQKIFVWSKQIEKNINNCVKKKAIYVEGLKANLILHKSNSNNIIYVGSPYYLLKKTKKDKKFFKILNYLKKNLNYENFIFCPHPMETNKSFLKKIKSLDIIISNKSAYQLSTYAKLILGDYSSFLFESSVNNIPTVQIKEMILDESNLKINEIKSIKYKEINDTICFKLGRNKKKNTQRILETKKIINFFLKK